MPFTAASPADESLETSVEKKALQINLDALKYGTFAEIGAGQEVARLFFHVGGASGTVAKTMSAYDMTFSDAIYGPTPRYVSRQRLSQMLEYEYKLLLERLADKRAGRTAFFVFANTVATRAYNRPSEGHGWLGVHFQAHPRAEPDQIIIHVRMLDKESIAQQEALGIIGVNLIHGAFYSYPQPEKLIASLLDSLSPERIQVDMIKFSGPDFHYIDNRLMALQLVEQGLTDAVLFNPSGEAERPDEAIYKKAVLVERGSFRPVTLTTQNILDCAQERFMREAKVTGEEAITLMEITMQNLLASGELDPSDFLDRVDVLGKLGRTVLISKFGEYFRLGAYLSRGTNKMIAIAMGIPSLIDLFQEKYYTNLEGGILESLGRLFKNDLKLYVYPMLDPSTGRIVTAGNLQVAPNLQKLYAHLLENHFIEELSGYNPEFLTIFSRDVLHRIRTGDATWETMVPGQVAEMIKKGRLYNYQPPAEL
jgi:hypothetical protein